MNTATITVKLFGPLRATMGSDQEMIISDNETIRTIVGRLPISQELPYLYSVNEQHSKADRQLRDGDVLMIIPPISGG